MDYKIRLIEKIPNTFGVDKFENKRPKVVLENDFEIIINGDLNVIPAGFEYDHASIPCGLWNTFPPYHPDYAAAALVHDFLYAGEIFDRKVNDKIFLAIMKAAGVSKVKRAFMYSAVRIGGKLVGYRKHTIDTVMKVRKLIGITSKLRPFYPDYRKGVLSKV